MRDYERIRWHKQEHLHNVWQLSFTDGEKESITVSIFEVESQREIQETLVFERVRLTIEKMEHWIEKIAYDLSGIAKEWEGVHQDFRSMSMEELRDAFQLQSILLDNQHHLTALYFNTDYFSGHQVVMEFNKEGEPFEAEISG